MSINELIDEWNIIKNKCIHKNAVLGGSPYFARGEEYDIWLMKCSRFLQNNYPNDSQTNQFISLAKDERHKETQYSVLIGILSAINEMPPMNKIGDIDNIIEQICINFHRCVKSLQNRYSSRETIYINDEYDVQDLFQGILRLFVNDVRPEDYVPSYAGGNSRTDFYLPQYETYIETKMIRNGLDDKKVGEELSIDITRYGDRCKKIICFIYDKDNKLKNPYGLINDLEKLGANRVAVKVYISPL